MSPGVSSAPSNGPQMWLVHPPQGSHMDAGSYADNHFHFFFFLATPCSLWDLSYLTRD